MVRREVLPVPSPERLSSRIPRRGGIFERSPRLHRRIYPVPQNSDEVRKKEGGRLFVPDYTKLRVRDESEWEKWIAEVTPSFISSALRVFPDIDIVEDFVQDAWLQVYERIDTIRPDNLNFYIQTIIHNKIKDHFRRARVRLVTYGDIPERKSPDSTEETIIRRDQARHLRRYIDQLTQEQREAILDFASGLSPTEVEEMTGIPAGVIKSRRHRAFRTLNRLIEAQK